LKNVTEQSELFDSLISLLIKVNPEFKNYLLTISDEDLYSSRYLRSIMHSTEAGRKYFNTDRKSSIKFGGLAYLQSRGAMSSKAPRMSDIIDMSGSNPTSFESKTLLKSNLFETVNDEEEKIPQQRRSSLSGSNIRNRLSAFQPKSNILS
jgi:hypothetical protein